LTLVKWSPHNAQSQEYRRAELFNAETPRKNRVNKPKKDAGAKKGARKLKGGP